MWRKPTSVMNKLKWRLQSQWRQDASQVSAVIAYMHVTKPKWSPSVWKNLQAEATQRALSPVVGDFGQSLRFQASGWEVCPDNGAGAKVARYRRHKCGHGAENNSLTPQRLCRQEACFLGPWTKFLYGTLSRSLFLSHSLSPFCCFSLSLALFLGFLSLSLSLYISLFLSFI